MARKPTKERDSSRDGLELDEDEPFQRLEWRIQRAAWVVMAAVIVAALAGLFGPGPLSTARAGADGDPLTVRYHRFLRYGVDTRVELDIRPRARNDTVLVRFDRPYLEAFEVLDVSPAPIAQAGTDREVVHEFRFAGAATPRIVYLLEPKSAGRVRGVISADGAGAVRVDSFVYP